LERKSIQVSVDKRDERGRVHKLMIDPGPELVRPRTGGLHRLKDLHVDPAIAELRPVGIAGVMRAERDAAQQRVDEVRGRLAVRGPEGDAGLRPAV